MVFAEAWFKKKNPFQIAFQQVPIQALSAYSQVTGNESRGADQWLEPPEAFAFLS